MSVWNKESRWPHRNKGDRETSNNLWWDDNNKNTTKQTWNWFGRSRCLCPSLVTTSSEFFCPACCQKRSKAGLRAQKRSILKKMQNDWAASKPPVLLPSTASNNGHSDWGILLDLKGSQFICGEPDGTNVHPSPVFLWSLVQHRINFKVRLWVVFI